MFKDHSNETAALRLKIREHFFEVDGDDLLRQSKAKTKGPYSELAKGRPSSFYEIPLLPSLIRSDSIMEFGPIHDPELLGGQSGDRMGMLLWCNNSNGQPFVELVKFSGNRSAKWHATEHGSFIELDDVMPNEELIMLAMKMVIDLISAFNITEQDQAVTDQTALQADKNIRVGRSGDKPKTI